MERATEGFSAIQTFIRHNRKGWKRQLHTALPSLDYFLLTQSNCSDIELLTDRLYTLIARATCLSQLSGVLR